MPVTDTGTVRDLYERDTLLLNNALAADPTPLLEGQIWYSAVEKCLSTYGPSAGAWGLGREHRIRVYNDSGATIDAGKPVYVSGANSPNALPTIALARADADATRRVVGLTTESIPNNSIGEVCQAGLVHALDTTAWNLGQMLYLSVTTAGEMTATDVTNQRYGVRCAVVVFRNASAGILLVVAGHESTSDILNIVNADLSMPTRAFSTNYTPNLTRPTLVVATVRIDTTDSITLLGGTSQIGHVELRSDNSATPSTERCRAEGGATFSGTVVVGVAITNASRTGSTLVWIVPPGQKYRLVTVNDAGTPTFTLISVGEVAL